jgi:hypothetical protein
MARARDPAPAPADEIEKVLHFCTRISLFLEFFNGMAYGHAGIEQHGKGAAQRADGIGGNLVPA